MEQNKFQAFKREYPSGSGSNIKEPEGSLNKNKLITNILINVMDVKNLNQKKLIKFLQNQNTNTVKRHLSILKNRNNLSQKKAYINTQLGHKEMFNLNPTIQSLQRAGLVLNENFTRNKLVRNANTIASIGNKLQKAGLYRNPYLKLLFTRTNMVKKSLEKDSSGANLRRIVEQAEGARQAFMARQFIGTPKIPFL